MLATAICPQCERTATQAIEQGMIMEALLERSLPYVEQAARGSLTADALAVEIRRELDAL